MFNPKLPAISGAVGFLLSLIAGLFSGAPFGIIMLRAVLCAAGAALFMLIASLLVRKFLTDGMDSFAPEMEENTGGGMVNITLDDDPLGNDEGSQLFFMPAAASSSNKTSDSVSSSERAPEQNESFTASASAPLQGVDTGAGVESLDSLPDIGNLFSDSAPSAAAEEALQERSEISSAVSAPVSDSGADTQTMAQAIRTMLSKDS